jgi:hypothetical protein
MLQKPSGRKIIALGKRSDPLSATTDAYSRKACRFNLKSLLFCEPFANFRFSGSMQQNVHHLWLNLP